MKTTILSRRERSGEDEAKSGSPPAVAVVAELAAAAQLSGERQTPLKTKTTSAKGRTSKQSCTGVCNPQPPVFNLNNIPIYIDAFFAFLDHHFEEEKKSASHQFIVCRAGACK